MNYFHKTAKGITKRAEIKHRWVEEEDGDDGEECGTCRIIETGYYDSSGEENGWVRIEYFTVPFFGGKTVPYDSVYSKPSK